MKVILFGSSGGIGTAIKGALSDAEFGEDFFDTDWVIFAQGNIDEADSAKTFRANVLLCIDQTRIVLPYVKKGFIYISSTAALKGNSKFPVYAASKAAVNVFCQSMAKAHPDKQFYAICPGPTDTKMWHSLNLEGTPQPPSAVAEAVLAAMNGSFKSGGIIEVRNSIIREL